MSNLTAKGDALPLPLLPGYAPVGLSQSVLQRGSTCSPGIVICEFNRKFKPIHYIALSHTYLAVSLWRRPYIVTFRLPTTKTHKGIYTNRSQQRIKPATKSHDQLSCIVVGEPVNFDLF